MMSAIVLMAITSIIGHAKLLTLKSTHNHLSNSKFSETLGSDWISKVKILLSWRTAATDKHGNKDFGGI